MRNEGEEVIVSIERQAFEYYIQHLAIDIFGATFELTR